MSQTRCLLLIEDVTNVTVGYALAVITQIVAFPLFGLVISLGDNLAIGAIFVGISLSRGYLLRRLFEGIQVKKRPAEAGPIVRRGFNSPVQHAGYLL